MPLKHLEKMAENAKQQLPGLVDSHKPPYSLAECQEFVAKLAGYPSWQVAERQNLRELAISDDPIMAFQEYDWHKIAMAPLLNLADPARCQITLHDRRPEDLGRFIERCLAEAPHPWRPSLVLINKAGEAGSLAIDQAVFNREPSPTKFFGTISRSSLNNRRGMTFNPLGGMPAQACLDLFTGLLGPVATPDQLACCQAVLRLMLPRPAPETLELATLQTAVCQLIGLATDNWPTDDEFFYDLFPDTSRHNSAHAFIRRYSEKLPALLRPLDTLLTRLGVPGLARTFRHHVLTCRTSSDAGYAWGFST